MDPVLTDERLTAIGLFIEASTAVRHALERASAEWGGMPANFEILMRLARSDAQRLRMADLAAQCGLSPSGVSRAVDRLVADGLVVRASCPTDARGMHAELTPKGNKLIVAALRNHVEDVQSSFLDVLSAEQRDQMESICRTLRDSLNPCATAGT
ncbi:MAG: MarR family transcriptional regulator [Acidimicrobiales bacterium]|nr:MarR family transcriptional regulator [Acidimicrobiales bacterium]